MLLLSSSLTRYYNSTKIEIKYNDRKEASNGKDKEKHALIDACARDLAEVDRESFQRSFFEDANNIFERLFLPMHFPWSHRAQKFDQEIRAMPCDIDDMFVVPTGNDSDDDEQEEDDEACEGDTVSCNRSAQDKGVIEIGHDRGAKRPKRHLNIAMEKQQVPHVNDFAYRMYQEVQSRKHHQAEKESEAPRCLLSIQCHGVSSKASIFTDVPDGKTALLLPAIQPRDIATGKRMAIAKAKEVSDQLGSYDCRHGLPNNTEEREQSGRRRRVFAGRTRMIWTRKEEDDKKLASPSTRPTYTSIITGETIPNGLHKRPLSVKVGFRLDGRLVTVDKSATECTTETLELALKSGEDCQVSHDANMVDKAFERPFTRSNAVANPKKPSPRRSTELRNGSRKKSH